jgi:transposase
VSNVLSEEKRQQVIALGKLGWTLRRIEKETGIRRETAGTYLRAAGVALRRPGGWGRHPPAKPANEEPAAEVTPDPSEPKPANGSVEVTPDSAPVEAPLPPAHNGSASTCEPHRDFIELWLSKGRNAKAIFQDMVDECGFRGSYQSVKRFVRKLQGDTNSQARAVITTAPGEEVQVDYGSGPMVRDAITGKYRRTRLFALTLGYSRKAIHLLTWSSSTRIWADLHEQAFRRLGGTCRIIVLDNLSEGVLKADIYDPSLNPVYRDLLKHYGVVALPCRVADPDRKGKVERSVGYAKNTPLKGRRFESMEEAQEYLDRWETRWADTRIHGTTKRQVMAMFTEEQPSLQPLPLEPFRSYKFAERGVNVDGCIEVECAYYSAPPGWIGRHVQAQWDQDWVRLLDPSTGQLLREHRRSKPGQYSIPPEDKPARTPLPTLQLLAKCGRVGLQVGELAQQMFKADGQVAVRRIQGLLSTAKRFGAGVTNDACAAALEMQISNNPYRFVRCWLERRPQLTLRQVDPIIRQLTLYRDLIDNKTQGEPE